MMYIFQWVKIFEQPIELLASAALFAFPLQKRQRPKLFLGICIVTGAWICCEGAILLFVLPQTNGEAANYLLALLWSTASFGTASAAIYAFCDVGLISSFYYATLAYLTQHFSYCLYEFVFPGINQASTSTQSISQNIFRLLAMICLFAMVYSGVWKFIAYPLSKGEQNLLGIGRSLTVMLIGLGTCLGLSATVQIHLTTNTILYRCCLIYAMLCCALILWNQVDLHNRLTWQHELDLQRQLWLRHKSQYERASAAVKLINHKCHDLKRQLSAFQQLSSTAQSEETRTAIREMTETVSVYDSIIETGNEILDTILSEKSLQCAAQNISFTCVADGCAISFVEAIDLFSMLGNALDNAVEAVLPLDDADRRAISVSVFSGQGVSILQVENYFSGHLAFAEGLPITTKGDTSYYGFGLKSIRRTAEKYGGVLSIRADDEIFMLRVTLPYSRQT